MQTRLRRTKKQEEQSEAPQAPKVIKDESYWLQQLAFQQYEWSLQPKPIDSRNRRKMLLIPPEMNPLRSQFSKAKDPDPIGSPVNNKPKVTTIFDMDEALTKEYLLSLTNPTIPPGTCFLVEQEAVNFPMMNFNWLSANQALERTVLADFMGKEMVELILEGVFGKLQEKKLETLLPIYTKENTQRLLEKSLGSLLVVYDSVSIGKLQEQFEIEEELVKMPLDNWAPKKLKKTEKKEKKEEPRIEKRTNGSIAQAEESKRAVQKGFEIVYNEKVEMTEEEKRLEKFVNEIRNEKRIIMERRKENEKISRELMTVVKQPFDVFILEFL